MIDNKKEYFEYLDHLRESGVCNMFGAGSYLEKEFDLDKKDARKVLVSWIEGFEKDEED